MTERKEPTIQEIQEIEEIPNSAELSEEEDEIIVSKKMVIEKTNNIVGTATSANIEGNWSIHVERPVYQQQDLNRDILYEGPKKSQKVSFKGTLRSCCSKNPSKFIKNTFPILKWLPRYEWKKWLYGDLVSGLTIAVMQIPQGMGYAMLGGVPPICGIYMAFFPVLMYTIFGTSRHISTGTFAIICLMTGKIVSQYTTNEILQDGTTKFHNDILEKIGDSTRTNIQVAITVTFTVACIQLIMFCFRLGIIATLFSDNLIRGLICATSCHVVASQLKDIFGLQLHKRTGYFNFVMTLYDVGANIKDAHIPAVIISAVTLFIILVNTFILERMKKKFPVEIFVVCLMTAFSYFFRNRYDVLKDMPIIGNIPTGFPDISYPDISLIPNIFLDCLVIAVVSYAITMSLALLFASKCTYTVKPNQELLALGMSNSLGCLFSCLPSCGSVSRSMIQETMGGKTQMASLISCGLLFSVLLYLGPAFESLPKCCLGTVIAAAIWSSVMKITLIVKCWKLSKWDAMVFMSAFLITLLLDIGLALGISVAIALIGMLLQNYKPYNCLLGSVPSTDLFLDLERYKGVQEIPGIKIFHFAGVLNFSSKDIFMKSFEERVGFNPSKMLRERSFAEEHNLRREYENFLMKFIIMDFSSITSLDPAGNEFLRDFSKNLFLLGISCYIAACSGPVYEEIFKCNKIEKKNGDYIFFPTIHDAVVFAQKSSVSVDLG